MTAAAGGADLRPAAEATEAARAESSPLLPLPVGRWCYSVPMSRASKCGAWLRCRNAGRKVGIPDHAWRRDHGAGFWRWHTAAPDRIDEQSAWLQRRAVEAAAEAAGLDAAEVTP